MKLGSPFHHPDEIDVSDAARGLAAGELVVVDVREPSEWRRGWITGAQHIPLATVTREIAALTQHGKPVAFICGSGRRSRAASAAARSHGIEAINVRGGMRAWQRAGLPTSRH